MAVTSEFKLKLRTVIPVFQLMTAEGKAISTWDFKGQRNMVLIFLPGEGCAECNEFLRVIVNMYHQFEEETAVVLPIVQGNSEKAVAIRDELRPQFPVLFDETGVVTSMYTDHLPAVFVTDRFGELRAEWIAGPGHQFPPHKDILDALELIELECPECGAPLDWS